MQIADTMEDEKRQKTVWHFKLKEDEKGVDKGEDGNVILKRIHDAVCKSKNSNNRKF